MDYKVQKVSKMNTDPVGALIVALLHIKGTSVSEIAEISGYSQSYASKVIARTRSCRAIEIAVAEALETKREELWPSTKKV